MIENNELIIAAIKGYNAKRREALKILYSFNFKKRSTNKQALNFIFEKLEICPTFYEKYTDFLIANNFLSSVKEKRNFVIPAAVLTAITAAIPLLGKIGQGKQLESQQDIVEQQTQQEMLRLLQSQAEVDKKHQQTNTIIAVTVIIAVFSIVGIILLKK